MRQVTSGFLKAGEGYFSPDGKQIVYQAVSTDYPFYQIYTQPLQAAGAPFPTPKLISTGRGRTTCAYFSPDGKKILFASSHLDPDMSKVRRLSESSRRKMPRPVAVDAMNGRSTRPRIFSKRRSKAARSSA